MERGRGRGRRYHWSRSGWNRDFFHRGNKGSARGRRFENMCMLLIKRVRQRGCWFHFRCLRA
jgi:hypothetical protein